MRFSKNINSEKYQMASTEDVTISKDLFIPIKEGALDADKMTRPSLSYWKDAARRFKKNPIAIIATILLSLIILFAIFAPVFSQYTFDENNWSISNQAPTAQHPFGTDTLGRDLWVRCWEGARVSLAIGVLVALVNATIGIFFGGISGFLGGAVDNVMMRICEVI